MSYYFVDFYKNGELPKKLKKFNRYFALVADIVNGVKNLGKGYEFSIDCRSPNIYKDIEGKFILVDPVWVDVPYSLWKKQNESSQGSTS